MTDPTSTDSDSTHRRSAGRRRILSLSVLGIAGCLRSSNGETQETGSNGDTSLDETDRNRSDGNDSNGNTNDDSGETDSTDLPPGVNQDGVTTSIVRHHEQTLAGERFDSSFVSVQSSGDTMVEERVTYEYDDTTFVTERSFRGSMVRVYVEDGDVSLQQAQTDSGVLYSDAEPALAILVSPLLSNQLFTHFDAASYVPTEWVDHDGESLLKAVAEDADDLSRLPLIRSPEDVVDFYGEALLTEDGVIRRLRVEIEKTSSDPESVEITFDPVDDASPVDPEWINEGREKVSRFDVSLINGGTAVELSHVGGNAPSDYLQVSAWEGGSGTNIGPDFTDGFAAGRTAYLARTEGTGLQIHDEPVSGDKLETPLKISLWSSIELLEVELS
ncbi:hypothetical protein [Halorubrum sp. N11]|uniref:hypothetical protein n=1 Tax=Halorubrum sp. N11 TaxID=3402276 RepID=UPI003EBD4575